MPTPTTVACATKTYTTPPWIWRDTHWELENSSGLNCICAQYAVYKLTGIAPSANNISEVTADPNNPTVITWLEENGFTASEPVSAAQGTPDNCGCSDQQSTRCAVVYQSIDTGSMAHIAVFDPQSCDWGGKLSGNGPIVRFAQASDYISHFGGDDAVNLQMIFYCHTQPNNYISDEDINQGLINVANPPSEGLGTAILRYIFENWFFLPLFIVALALIAYTLF